MTTEAEVRISAEVAEQHLAAKLKDALIAQQAAEIERLKAEAFDSTSMYNRCVDDVHAARAEIERLDALLRQASELLHRQWSCSAVWSLEDAQDLDAAIKQHLGEQT